MSSAARKNPTMRAWAIDAYGSPNRMQLMELPVPEPKSGDVLIYMHGAEVGDCSGHDQEIILREFA